jgi:hypothetical protein
MSNTSVRPPCLLPNTRLHSPHHRRRQRQIPQLARMRAGGTERDGAGKKRLDVFEGVENRWTGTRGANFHDGSGGGDTEDGHGEDCEGDEVNKGERTGREKGTNRNREASPKSGPNCFERASPGSAEQREVEARWPCPPRVTQAWRVDEGGVASRQSYFDLEGVELRKGDKE